MRQEKPDWQTKIAKERIDILFSLAKTEISKNPSRSKRYVELARKIGTRYKVRLPAERKAGFCKKCSTLLLPGKTSSVRIDGKTKAVTIKCLGCNYSYRKRYK